MSNSPEQPIRLMLIDDETDFREAVASRLKRKGISVWPFVSGVDALDHDPVDPFDVALLDLRMPHLDGLEVLEKIKQIRPFMEVIILTGHGTVETAIKAIKLGAYDYLQKPFENAKLDILISKAYEKSKISCYTQELEDRIQKLNKELRDRYSFHSMVGKSRMMEDVFYRIEAAGKNNSTVMIVGESGTGKELVARAIHYEGDVSDKPFVPVNCAALPRELIESELFGYKKGSFTGATSDSAGLFKAAEGGTIFLDEISEMAPDVQAKLLRVLQERRIRPVGQTKETPINVRVITASNQNLQKAVEVGALREDLYYRLAVGTIRIPPLRERPEDIPVLIQHFIKKNNENSTRQLKGVDRAAMDLLMNYNWPGNVRELENVIESVFTFGRGTRINKTDLPPHIAGVRQASFNKGLPFADVIPIKEAERLLMIRALEKFKGNKARAARALGISRKQFYVKMDVYGIARESKERT